MSRKPRLPKSPLDDERWPLTPEEELALFLEMELQKLQEDPSHALPAFNALAYIISAVWQREDTGRPETKVTLPRWVAEKLAEGFFRYRDAAHGSEYISLGQAYGLEGRGQGKQPPIVGEKNILRDIRLVTTIAKRRLDGIKLEAALQEMVDATGLSIGQVRRIWEKHRTKALSALKNLRTRKSL